jgi:dTMP kinase
VARVTPGGLLIAFEGGDGAGKSTQVAILGAALRSDGCEVVETYEPGHCLVGPAVRSIVLDVRTRGLSPRAEALLYAADRAQHVDELVRPALARGAIVLTDRYADSSVAYQGVGRGLDPDAVASLSEFATGSLQPDLTVLLDLAPAVALARSVHPPDRLEGEPLEFHALVGAAFRALAARAPGRYAVVDAGRSVEDVAAEVAARVASLLARGAREA